MLPRKGRTELPGRDTATLPAQPMPGRRAGDCSGLRAAAWGLRSIRAVSGRTPPLDQCLDWERAHTQSHGGSSSPPVPSDNDYKRIAGLNPPTPGAFTAGMSDQVLVKCRHIRLGTRIPNIFDVVSSHRSTFSRQSCWYVPAEKDTQQEATITATTSGYRRAQLVRIPRRVAASFEHRASRQHVQSLFRTTAYR